MADAIQSFLEQSETEHIPQQHPICCCGNAACAYLRHNQSALDGLEKDVSTAARLGKVCNFSVISLPPPMLFQCAQTFGSHASNLMRLQSHNVAALGEISGRHVIANVFVAGAIDAT